MGRRVFVTNTVTGLTILLFDLTLEQAARWRWLAVHEYIHGPIIPERTPWEKAPPAILQADGSYRCGSFVAAKQPPSKPEVAMSKRVNGDPFPRPAAPANGAPIEIDDFDLADNGGDAAAAQPPIQGEAQAAPIELPALPGEYRLRQVLGHMFPPGRGGE